MPMMAGELMLSTTNTLCFIVWLLTVIGSSNSPITRITLVDALSNRTLDGFLTGRISTGIFLNSLKASTVTLAPVSYNQFVVTPLRLWTLIKGRGTDRDSLLSFVCRSAIFQAHNRSISSILRLLSKTGLDWLFVQSPPGAAEGLLSSLNGRRGRPFRIAPVEKGGNTECPDPLL